LKGDKNVEEGMSKISSIEEKLWKEAERVIEELRGLREPKVEDIFTRKYYISPEDLWVDNYLRSRPLAAFNPGALERNGDILIFPRLIFDYYKYVSSVACGVINIEKLINDRIEKPLKVKIVLWPEESWEFLGCEDPRISLVGEDVYMLYTGKGYYYENKHAAKRRDVLGFVKLSPSWEIKRKGYFVIARGSSLPADRQDKFMPVSNKDSAFVEIKDNKATMLTRPEVHRTGLCWRAEADLENLVIYENTLKLVLPLEKWEAKVGWSTNVVKLSTGKYLVGWHGVLKEDLSYRNGLAIVDGSGELLAVSDYLLAPRGLEESYGDRPLVIFGNGLIRYKNHLIWIGGVSDYCIGIFITELDKALEKLRWIRNCKV